MNSTDSVIPLDTVTPLVVSQLAKSRQVIVVVLTFAISSSTLVVVVKATSETHCQTESCHHANKQSGLNDNDTITVVARACVEIRAKPSQHFAPILAIFSFGCLVYQYSNNNNQY